MSLAVAIVADDLTGALDAAAPFAARGLVTRVALRLDALPEAIEGADVVAINTASRHLAPVRAAHQVWQAAQLLAAYRPTFCFKKVDSRLKGPVEAEIAAALHGFALRYGLICPAIPDLGRFVVDGAVVGVGVAQPIAVAQRIGGLKPWLHITDARNGAALSAAVERIADEKLLAVGARGLGDALAQHLTGREAVGAARELPEPALVCVGSIDPITRRQLAVLDNEIHLPRFDAAEGTLPAGTHGHERATLLATAEGGGAAPSAVAEQFARGITDIVRRDGTNSLVLTGGETADAVLRALEVGTLSVEGEVLAGVPRATARLGDGRSLTVVTKSGGFGEPHTLVDLIGR